MTGLLCYVLGCHSNGYPGRVRSVRHRTFGLTTACDGHDPNKYSEGLPLAGQVPTAPAYSVEDRRPNTGPMAPLLPVSPSYPPASQAQRVRGDDIAF